METKSCKINGDYDTLFEISKKLSEQKLSHSIMNIERAEIVLYDLKLKVSAFADIIQGYNVSVKF